MDKKTYLVTGASKGIGRAIARSLANDGYQVILLARASDDLDSACVEIQSDSPSSFSIACDLSQPEAIDLAIESLEGSGCYRRYCPQCWYDCTHSIDVRCR